MSRSQWYTPAVMVLLLGACGLSTDEAATNATPAALEESSYCAALSRAAQVLDDGGSTAEYNELLALIAAESPANHADTWALMLELSAEPFSYENFNPAADSLDRISVDLNSTCSGMDRMFVDDAGRMRQQPSG